MKKLLEHGPWPVTNIQFDGNLFFRHKMKCERCSTTLLQCTKERYMRRK